MMEILNKMVTYLIYFYRVLIFKIQIKAKLGFVFLVLIIIHMMIYLSMKVFKWNVDAC